MSKRSEPSSNIKEDTSRSELLVQQWIEEKTLNLDPTALLQKTLKSVRLLKYQKNEPINRSHWNNHIRKSRHIRNRGSAKFNIDQRYLQVTARPKETTFIKNHQLCRPSNVKLDWKKIDHKMNANKLAIWVSVSSSKQLDTNVFQESNQVKHSVQVWCDEGGVEIYKANSLVQKQTNYTVGTKEDRIHKFCNGFMQK